jgi:dienelactone hydrolase
MVHGAGDIEGATSFSRTHRVASIAIDRVGTGDTNGPPDEYNQSWLDLGRDMRDGWMVQYVTNALRAITYMQLQPGVDPSRVGVTGGSRGGTMTLIANGVDPRITLAIPTATCGDILTAFDHGGWANGLYRREDGQPGIPPLFRVFSLHGDPIHYARNQHGRVVLILGAQDEFFPIYTVKTFCQALATPLHLCLIADWDHGLFSSTRADVDTYDNREEAGKRTQAAIQYAIECYLHGKRPMPQNPQLSLLYRNGQIEFRATPDLRWPVEQVDLVTSVDGAYFFKRQPMQKIYENFRESYVASVPVSGDDLARLACFVEVKHRDGPYLASVPEFGLGFQQKMRVVPPRVPGPEPSFAVEETTVPLPGGTVQAWCALERSRPGSPLLVLLGPAEGDRLSVSWDALRRETERFSRRGLFAVGARLRDVEEVQALLAHLGRAYPGQFHPGAVSLVGYSGGGALALDCVGQMPDRFRMVAAYSPWAEETDGERMAAAAGNDVVTPVRIFADLEDPSLHVAERWARAAVAAGRTQVLLLVSHPSDGLRWKAGWPETDPVLRRTEGRFLWAAAAVECPETALPASGTLVAAPAVRTRLWDVLVRNRSARVRVDYAIQGNRISIRLTPLTDDAEACEIRLGRMISVAVDGQGIDVPAQGDARFPCGATGTIVCTMA